MAIFDFELTDGGDLTLDTLCNPVVVIEDEAIVQIIKQHLKLWINNWFLVPEYGTDWISILGKGVTRQMIIQVLTASLLQIDFVEEVVDVFTETNVETRQATLTYILIANGREFKETEEI